MSRWDAALRIRRSSGRTRSRSVAPRAASARTYAAVAADLGITAESLRTWGRKENEFQALPERREAGGSPAGELARLRAENARLLKAEKEWWPGVRAGAPDAVQVADRFPPWKNLSEAAHKTAVAHHGCPRQATRRIDLVKPRG
jgi:transposase-like protein